MQTACFVATGLLMIAAAGTREALEVTFGPALLTLFGVGLVGLLDGSDAGLSTGHRGGDTGGPEP